MRKSGTGELAPVLWQQGRHMDVVDYRLRDDADTTIVLRAMQNDGVIKHPRTGEIVKICAEDMRSKDGKNKTWKNTERKVAAFLGGERFYHRTTARRSAGHSAQYFSLEVKPKATAGMVNDAMRQAVASLRTDQHCPSLSCTKMATAHAGLCCHPSGGRRLVWLGCQLCR